MNAALPVTITWRLLHVVFIFVKLCQRPHQNMPKQTCSICLIHISNDFSGNFKGINSLLQMRAMKKFMMTLWWPMTTPIETSASVSGTTKTQYRKFETIFPEKELWRHSHNSDIHVSVAIYIFSRSVCLFCCKKICGRILGIYKSLTDTWNVEIRTEAAQFLFCDYINGIFDAVGGRTFTFIVFWILEVSRKHFKNKNYVTHKASWMCAISSWLLASWSPSVPYGMLLDFRAWNIYHHIFVYAG